jgi:hypothetical protein
MVDRSLRDLGTYVTPLIAGELLQSYRAGDSGPHREFDKDRHAGIHNRFQQGIF